MIEQTFHPGIDVRPTQDPPGFKYGPVVFGPEVERRKLDDIRWSLRDPSCDGPETVYAIAMDVGKTGHRPLLTHRMLLFGLVTYAAGRLGEEPVRSQGHVHAVSSHSGWSPPEVYEIWTGEAVVYMQERVEDDPGRCFAVHGTPGDVIIVPPGWAHATISARTDQPLTFGAWCDRESNFEYEHIKQRNGLAWIPLLDDDNGLTWTPNDQYDTDDLVEKEPAGYQTIGVTDDQPIYTQFENDPDRFQFVSRPGRCESAWDSFVP